MIKINLLPIRASKRKESARQQLLILLVSLFLVVGVALAAYSFLLIKISSTNKEIARSEQEIQELKAKIGKIKDLEKLKADVQKKLDVLSQLRRGKSGPVHRLSTLSSAVPDKLWLTGYSESQTGVKVTGVAFTEELIASFMRSLQDSEDFTNVELVVSEQVEMAGLKLKKFELAMSLKNQPTPPTSAKTQNK
jgi:type IV pilus assembly protein PilN